MTESESQFSLTVVVSSRREDPSCSKPTGSPLRLRGAGNVPDYDSGVISSPLPSLKQSQITRQQSPNFRTNTRTLALSIPQSSRYAEMSVEAQRFKRGKSRCGRRGMVPNPGHARGLAGSGRTSCILGQVKTLMKTTNVLLGILIITAVFAMQLHAQFFSQTD